MALAFVLSALFVIALFLVPIAKAYGDTDLRHVDEWAAAHAVELTDHSRPMVFWYLRNARVLRTLGVLAGVIVPGLVAIAFGGAPRFPQHWVWLLVGYFAGALYAEVSLSRPRPTGRTVTLVARDVSWYLPGRLIVAQRVMLIAAPMLAFSAAIVPMRDGAGELVTSRWPAVAGAVVAAVVMVVAIATERWIVSRPQPFTARDMLEADDAIRAQSVHSLAGSGLGAALLVLTGTFWLLANSDVQALRWTMGYVTFACPIAALIAVRYYAHRAWRVQRPAIAAAT